MEEENKPEESAEVVEKPVESTEAPTETTEPAENAEAEAPAEEKTE